MQISLNTLNSLPISLSGSVRNKKAPVNTSESDIQQLVQPLSENKSATIPPLKIMKGITPNKGDVFDIFTKIDDKSRTINFVKKQSEWDDCLLEEIEEFKVARKEYEAEKSQRNYDHMEEEMGDILYTAASIAKDSGIDPKEAFRATNRKFYNRINLMERLCVSQEDKPNNLKDCTPPERRALWNTAKRKINEAQALQYLA
jgi:uncharacterized protein YabN with tetrapyrrole methylase and pyrophosphatase domain